MAGADGVFRRTVALISPDRQNEAVIRCGDSPERVRYAWQNNPLDSNLVNEERLPAATFEHPVNRP